MNLSDEVGMREWRLNRALVQLRDSGVLDKADGVILGDFSKTQETKPGSGLKAKILDSFRIQQPRCMHWVELMASAMKATMTGPG